MTIPYAARKRAPRGQFRLHLAVLMLFCACLMWAGTAFGQAAPQRPPGAPPGTGDIATDYWRDLRQGGSGYSASSPTGQSDLINAGGTTWMTQRNEEIVKIGAWVFALFAGGVAVFYLARGTVRLDKGYSGRVVERWTLFNRVLHWWVAGLFLIQLISGVIILYGKSLLIPLIGKEGFATLALLSKNAHNYLGPLLFVGLVVMVIAWLKDNMPKAIDFKWFASGGGLVGKGHPSAGFLNGGEKVWFWIVAIAGGSVMVTGMVLDFPQFGQTRETMQEMHYLHTVGGLIIGAATLGHIYIATLGTEGAFRGMWSGYVDVNWAKQHHDLWFETVKDKAVAGPQADKPEASSGGEEGVKSTSPA